MLVALANITFYFKKGHEHGQGPIHREINRRSQWI